MNKLITIVGPTAVGKTDLTIELAKIKNAPVISGDAYQIYKELNIGSAKPTLDEMQGVYHYLIDKLSPFDTYSVADFQCDAKHIIAQENKNYIIPILSGGTGLYVQALLENYDFSKTEPDVNLRAKLDAIFGKEGIEGIRNYADKLANQYKVDLKFSDKHRLYRAIELMSQGDVKPLQEVNKQGLSYEGPVIGLQRQRETLYERINLRVNIMVEKGLFTEVESLLQKGLTEENQSMKGIGYKEVIPYLKGIISKDECIDLIKKNTRHFAKRQITWYKRMPYIQWITIRDGMTSSDILEEALLIVNRKTF